MTHGSAFTDRNVFKNMLQSINTANARAIHEAAKKWLLINHADRAEYLGIVSE